MDDESVLVSEGMELSLLSVSCNPDRYDKIVKHDHLVCKKCGALSDICLSDLTAQLQEQISEEIISYDLKVNYICPFCRSKAEKE